MPIKVFDISAVAFIFNAFGWNLTNIVEKGGQTNIKLRRRNTIAGIKEVDD